MVTRPAVNFHTMMCILQLDFRPADLDLSNYRAPRSFIQNFDISSSLEVGGLKVVQGIRYLV
jgi:hypothetical protein